MVPLGDVVAVNPRSDSIAGDSIVAFVGMAQLSGLDAKAVPLEPRRYSEVSNGYTVFRDGDILAAKITPCWENGKIGQAELDCSVGVGSTEFHVLRGNSELIDQRYLLHFVRQPRIRQSGGLRMTGSAGQRRVPASFLANLEIPLPCIAEQRRIAAILDQADAVRTKRRQVLAHLDDLSQSIFQDMFGRISAQAVVSDIATAMRTGPFGSQLLREELIGDGISVLGLDNVVDNEFRWGHRRYISPEKYDQLRRYTVYSGDVLISIMGTTGRCAIVPEDIPTAINTKHICAVTVDSSVILPGVLRAVFLWHRESRNYLRRQTKGAIMDGLNMGIIKRMPVPIPSIAQQSEFVARLDAVASRRSSVQRALATDDELFASLQSRAFRGEL